MRPYSTSAARSAWLRIPERIAFRLAVLVFRCRNSTASEYLVRDLHWAVDDDSCKRLRSASSHKLVVQRYRLKTVGDRVFGVAAPPVWNGLPSDVTSAQSSSTFKNTWRHVFSDSHLLNSILYFVTCSWSFGLRQAKFVVIIIIIIIIIYYYYYKQYTEWIPILLCWNTCYRAYACRTRYCFTNSVCLSVCLSV